MKSKRVKNKFFTQQVCVCALLDNKLDMRKKQRRNEVKYEATKQMGGVGVEKEGFVISCCYIIFSIFYVWLCGINRDR